MIKQMLLEKYLRNLLSGNRVACRNVIEETLHCGIPANQVYVDLIWPIMVEVDSLYRAGTIDSAQEAFASRINRTIVNQLQNKLPRRPGKVKRVVIFTADNEQAELGGQMITDLFESDGWDTRFLGGTCCNDDILSFIHSFSPDILVLYGMNGPQAPSVRELIDAVREINAWPDMRIMLSGGVFDRAQGLWEEIGADLYAEDPAQAVQIANMSRDEIPAPQRLIKQRQRAGEKSEAQTVAAAD